MPLYNRTLLVFKYLWDNTDENLTVSIADITKYLSESGVSADPRTLRKDIDQLTEFGVDIIKYRGTQNQYHIASRHFDAPEIKLLIDAVQSARFITKTKSKNLIEKLAVFVAPSQKDILRRQFYVDSRSKAVNEHIYITVDRIQTAIAEKRKITFQYYDYGPDKSRILRHNGQKYSVSPYTLIWYNDTYYMAGFHDGKQLVAKFRVDRIINLDITEEDIIPHPEDFSVSEFFTQEFSMYDGVECEVTLLCENRLMNSIIDRFGESVHTEIVDEDHFKAITTVDLSCNFYGWVFASEGKMKIIAPEEAVDGFKNILKLYQK